MAIAEVRAIAEAAAAAYARDKALCRSAHTLPRDLPRGGAPVPTNPSEFVGDARSGWPCLGYTPKSPYLQYSYRAKATLSVAFICTTECEVEEAPLFGATPKPEPDRYFEACAEADPTPGGRTLRVCWFGAVAENKTIKLGTQPVVFDEHD